MLACTIYLAVLSVAATLVSARPSTSYLAHNYWTLSGVAHRRQNTGIPSQCTSTCDPINNEVNAGCPVTACCTQSFETGYYNCFMCVGNADNATDYSGAQTDLDNLYVACADLGYPLQELTFPGQNPSRTLSTSFTGSTLPATSTSSSSVSMTLSQSVVNPSSIVSPSSTSPSSGTTTGSSTATSSTSTSTGAALGVGSGTKGVWAVAAAVAGLVIL
ncbi:hypothetical protein M405DRAFT_812386 [Rhizopogon salebrosus TDB-379]|nr:hypothetical protein M405DRAFT_812386 [Rhizopogon salebrosus TDB-379]